MPYQVLALKYRPKTFDEVVGQRAVVQTLKNSLAGNRIHHAYLFSGVRGVGKTTVARLLAKALNCVKGTSPEPCNECSSCQEIATSSSMDVLEIDGASNNSVDDVRELRETVRYAPSRDRYRIFIIDEVHMLSNSAFNALLKTLEEPPPHVIFVFATTEYRKIPVTILSRCQHFEFRKIARSAIAAHLEQICKTEQVAISAYARALVARLADGSLRDAQSTLDQVIAYSGNEVKDEDVRVILGILDRDLLTGIIEKIADKDAVALIGLVDRIFESGHDPAKFVSDLIGQVRDLLLLKILPDAPQQLGFAKDDVEAMTPLAERFSQEDLLRIIDVVAREEARIRYSPQPRYLLEALVVRLSQLGDLTPLDELLARFPEDSDAPRAQSASIPRPSRPPAPPKRKKSSGPEPPLPGMNAKSMGFGSEPPPTEEGVPMEELLPSGPPTLVEVAPGQRPSRPAPPSAEPGGENRPPEAPAESEGPVHSGGEVEAILEKIHAQPGALGGFLSHASFFNIEDGAFIISLAQDKAMFRPSIERKEYLALIRKATEEVTGQRLKVKVRMVSPIMDPKPSAAAAAEPSRETTKKKLLEKANQSPVVQSFLDLFQGEITDIEEV